MNNLKLVKINSDYCDYLRKYDEKVPYNMGKKELRPFVGILFKMNNLEYFAPLSSPKPKHVFLKNNIDLLKIDDGNLGVINFNNMIPVYFNIYEIINFNKDYSDESDRKYYSLLQKQLNWLNSYKIEVYKQSRLLYNTYIHDTLNIRVKQRCCDFPLLEKKAKLYKKPD